MTVALGSVLVAGVSAGMLIDGLLVDRADEKGERQDRRHEHGAGPSMFRFDCRSWEDDGQTATAEPEAAERREPEDGDRRGEHARRAAERLGKRLELAPEQVDALAPIFADVMNRSHAYWRGARDEFCAMQMDFHEQVSALLEPDQAARFDEWRAELAERGRRHDSDRRGDRQRHDSDSGDCR